MEASKNLLMSGTNNTLQYLPSEITTDILLRLPVKALLKFSCVCKTWRTLISSSYFTKAHLEISKNSKNYANHSLILWSRYATYSKFTCPLSSILANDSTLNLKSLYYPTPVLGKHRQWIYGNCNGLLCVLVDSTLELYNPTTRKLKRLPDSGTGRHWKTYGLCYHALDDDYRVVQLYTLRDRTNENYLCGVNIYSLRSNSWKEINDYSNCSALIGSSIPGVPVGGLLHWEISNTSCQIFVVDTVTYTHGTLAGPKYDNRDGDVLWGILDVGGYLGVYHEYSETRLEIWMMKGSWTKVLSLPYHFHRGWIYPLVGLRDDEILLRSESGYSISNSRDNSYKESY